ncbi:MAG: hypothetical protein ACQKBV_08460 [Puniceicoccales bacterium]
MFSRFSFRTIATLTTAFALAHTSFGDAQTTNTGNAPTAASAIEASGAQTGRYSVETVNAFLEQFVGTWEGKYSISTMEGQVLKALEVQMTYEWEQAGDTQVLVNQSIYSEGEQINISQSKSYFWRGRLASEVTENDVKRVYLGTISQDGKKVSWNPVNTEDFTRTAIEESFTSVDGQPTLKIQGYEDYTKGVRRKMLLLSGSLTRVKAE